MMILKVVDTSVSADDTISLEEILKACFVYDLCCDESDEFFEVIYNYNNRIDMCNSLEELWLLLDEIERTQYQSGKDYCIIRTYI